MIQAVEKRRSVRKYLNKEISEQDIREIIKSGIQAPSAKNRQPWKFVVVQGNAKSEMLKAFNRGINREENGIALLPESQKYIESAKHTIKILEQSPVVIFAVNPLGKGFFKGTTPEERIYDVCNIQSISAAIQNIILEATEMGIGSLWVCDIFFAYQELSEWLNVGGELLAAVALGYPDESPDARPRKQVDKVVEWRY